MCVRLATAADREHIYRMRHEIYARELGQHSVNGLGRICDALDEFNHYIIAETAGGIAGFISITPPGKPAYSIDKYVARDLLPFTWNAGVFEVRLLTVAPGSRGRRLAALLMYAAFRWVESHGGTRIVAIGRREVLGLYRKAGLELTNLEFHSGAVRYQLMHGIVEVLRARVAGLERLLARITRALEWRLPISFIKPAGCFHGGAFFDAIGPGLRHLERRETIINADVLDAWFPPAPGVISALSRDLDWIVRTSPPTDCSGMVEAIATARGVQPTQILPGAGSSDLIFRALREWLTPQSRALILDPTYGEYAHVLERVIGCRVSRLCLARNRGFAVSIDELESHLEGPLDLIVLVNPNSPTGRHLKRRDLEAFLQRVPAETRVWIDETYIDYAGPCESMEKAVAASENGIVCKSMSKVYALSGARAAYLCAAPHQLESLRAITPPWVVGLPAQVAAIRALEDPAYYAARHAETHSLRESLGSRLREIGIDPVPGCANFILGFLPESGPDAAEVVDRCRRRGLFIRNAGATSAVIGPRAIRVAVKDATTNERIAVTIAKALEIRAQARREG